MMTATAVSRATGRGRPIGAVIRRVPLSLAMMLVTTVSAVATGALAGGTPRSIVERFGYSLDNLSAGDVWALATSDWIVNTPRHWASMLLLFALFCVPLEAIAGTTLLAAAFWIGSWGGTMVTSLLIRSLSAPLDWHPLPDLVHQADVGGSVGTWSAAGALLVVLRRQPTWLVWPARLGALAYLLRQILFVHGSADVAHPLGLVIGTGAGLWYAHRHLAARRIERADLALLWRRVARRGVDASAAPGGRDR